MSETEQTSLTNNKEEKKSSVSSDKTIIAILLVIDLLSFACFVSGLIMTIVFGARKDALIGLGITLLILGIVMAIVTTLVAALRVRNTADARLETYYCFAGSATCCFPLWMVYFGIECYIARRKQVQFMT